MILSSIIIQCSSFSEKEFLVLKNRIGLLDQNFFNDDRLKNLEKKVESLKIDMENRIDEGKCLNICFHYITTEIN
jgi:hypothetical protein